MFDSLVIIVESFLHTFSVRKLPMKFSEIYLPFINKRRQELI